MLTSKKITQSLLSLNNGKKEFNEDDFNQFINFLKRKKSLYLLSQIKKHVEKFSKYNLYNDVFSIYSRYVLSEKEISLLKKKIGVLNDVSVYQIQDETLLGGFIVIYNGYIYDGSLKNQVLRFKKTLIY